MDGTTGTIVSINTRAMRQDGRPHPPGKFQAGNGRLGRYGLMGDYHNKAERWSYRRQIPVPNVDRHISVVSLEVINAANGELGLSLNPGDLGENLTVRGMGDLSNVTDGSQLLITSSADGTPVCTLRVVEQMMPCINLSSIHNKLAKYLMGRRGLYCAIEVDLGRRLCAKDKVTVHSPA